MHGALALASCVLGSTLTAQFPWRLTLAAALTLPVLVAMPGVWHVRSSTLRGFAVLLVLYVGLGAVEVLATGGAWPASVFLGAAGIQFILLMALLRLRPAAMPRE